MASNELIIDDDYCRAMGSYFEKQGNEMDDMIVDYISILEDVRSKGISDGETAKVLTAYIDYVKKLNKKTGNVSKNIKGKIDRFLVQVDAEDKYLF